MSRCPGCGGVVGRDCFNPTECVNIGNSIQEDHIRRLEALQATEKHFLDESKEQQEIMNKLDIIELMHYYGGWSELKKVIESIEENQNEAAWERAQNRDL